MQPPAVLTLAANDPLGGAGVSADLATFAALGVHGAAVVTAVSAQRLGSVDRVDWIGPEMVAAQVDSAVADLSVAAMKTGLLGRADTVALVAARARARAVPAPVVDPVLVDGRGRPIVDDEVIGAYRALLAVARVVTPNLAEARLLTGSPDATVEDMVPKLAGLGADLVVVTGGAGIDCADDAVIGRDGRLTWLRSARVDTRNVRGSGCTFSAAIAAWMAQGREPGAAVELAHRFVRGRLGAGAKWDYGGVGPVSHFAEESDR